jgi:peptide/nickel transport system permease protein
LDLTSVVWAPIPYSPGSMDRYNRDYAAPSGKQRFKNSTGEIIEIPSKFRHKLGTDGIGRDLASGLIHGTRISLMVGLVSMGIASLIGIILGALAGFFGDTKLKMPRIKYHFTLFGVFMGLFYGFGQRKYILSQAFSEGIGVGVVIGITMLFRILSKAIKVEWLNKEVSVPMDTFVSRGIELLNSIPRLLLIITITAVVERSIWIVMIIIGITGWTGIARFTRAEFLRIRSLEFVQAAESLGYSSIRTIFKHALPNSLAPVFVSIAFGIASAILIESGLSFLGIGVPDDIVTWGSLLNLGRQNLEAWWLIIYPGMAIFLTITIYNMIAEASRDALDPRLKS